MGKTCDLGVLLGDAVSGVDHDEAHIRPLNGQLGTHNGELLHPLVHLGLAADARRVDEHIAAVLVFIQGVHRVPGGAGHVADNDPLFAQNVVDERGFAHIGLANDGHLDAVVLFLPLVLLREVLQALVQQVAGAVAVYGGDGDGVSQSQGVKFIYRGVGGSRGVGLVHRQHHGLAGTKQHVGHILVRGGDAGADIRDQNDHGGGVDGDLGLLPHEEQNLAVGAGLNAAGVHHVKFSAAPLALGIEPVAGDAGGVLNDGEPLSHQAVEKHGLSHIGAAYDSNKRS